MPDPAEQLTDVIDDYAVAFDEAMAMDADPAPAPVDPAPVAPAPPVAADPAPAPVEAPAAPAPAAPPAELVQLQTQVADLMAQLTALKAAPQTQATAAQVDELEDELKWLEGEFASDWPDMKKAIDIVKKLVTRAQEGKIKEVADTVTPLVQKQEAQAFYGELKALVPDVDTIRDGFIGWVKSQPEALRKAYTSIVETGTPQDTAALISLYKQAVPAPVSPPAAPAIPAATKLRNMEDLGTRRSATAAPAGALDYDSAFNEADRDPNIR
jgi:polyhydroxyalkanoate synthesis regulator phasin